MESQKYDPMALYKVQLSAQLALYNAVMFTSRENVKGLQGMRVLRKFHCVVQATLPHPPVEVDTKCRTHPTGRNRRRCANHTVTIEVVHPVQTLWLPVYHVDKPLLSR